MSNMQKSHQNAPASAAARVSKPDVRAAISLKPEQLLAAPETLRQEDVISAQQQLGNQVVQRALNKTARQRERNTDEHGNLSPKIAESIQKMRGSGSPLPDEIQKEAGEKFGRGFSNVRIHVDEKADKLSRSINARAFTIGSDIFFKNGVFAPGSSAGRETLIHELTHVVQQGGSRAASGRLKLGAPDTAMEKEADQMGKKHSQGSLKSTAAPVVAAQKQAHAVVSRKMNNGGLPDNLNSEVENHAGRSAGGAGVHSNSSDVAGMGALAYAQGSDIHVGSGQGQYLAHEAGHVVQQRHGLADDSVHRQADEEELQMQPAEDEEEVLQMQPAEDEEEVLQMQPDSGGTVQRELSHDDILKKSKKATGDPQKAWLAKGNTPAKKFKSTIVENRDNAKKNIKGIPLQAKDFTKDSSKGIAALEKTRAEKFEEMQSFSDRPGKDGKLQRVASPVEKQVSSREKLMATISNKTSKTEDVKAAQEKLDMLHKRSKTDTFKSFFTPGASTKSFSEQAQSNRKKNLKLAARGGDEDAFNKLKAEKAERKATKAEADKNSMGGKIKGVMGGLFGKATSMLGDKAKSMASSQVDNIKTHFVGKSEKEDSAPAAERSGSSNANAGIGAMMEKYGELVRKNQELEQKLAKYEPKA